ncbi:hypothetical protein SLS59_009812 [Nothophoma quercina]|uniref:Amino acid transporter n=1 Tax=Nothophoma quercina TaxID=749835 RepID=A0ABR3QJW7_9PLEO
MELHFEKKETKASVDLERLPSQRYGQICDVRLEGLVLQNEDARNMSGLETISAGWIICNSWAGIAATFALAIAQGGPVTLVYGPIVMCVLVGACAVSLAELASVYPTAGGQYHWVSILAPEKWNQGLSTESVWTTFLNESGWSNGIAFLTGLVSPNYMYAGIDGAVHLAEECRNPGVVVPRALMSTVSIGFITSFIFAIIMMYCTSDLEAVVSTATGVPVYEIWRQATRSDVAATVFLVLLLFAAVFALNATHQTASRLTWSFARDDAMFGSRWLGKINEKQQVPIAALLFNFAIMFIIGCIYLGSTSTFNAFIGTGLILQHVTYAFPAALLITRKRSAKWLPDSRPFRMPVVVGWAANITTVAFAVLVLIFYDFPTVLPVSGSSMSKYYKLHLT